MSQDEERELPSIEVEFHRGEERWRGQGREGESLLQLARRVGAPIESDCSGAGSCVLCRVKVKASLLSEPTRIERDRLGNLFHLTGERMACQAKLPPASSSQPEELLRVILRGPAPLRRRLTSQRERREKRGRVRPQIGK